MSRIFQFRVPSKTFLLGEYLALTGRPSVVAATAPYFEFSLVLTSEQFAHQVLPFHPDSPAGRWLRQTQFHISAEQEWKFFDPHEGRGGFGASTAQFLFVREVSRVWSDSNFGAFDLGGADSAKAIWRDYRSLPDIANDMGRRRASGADLVAQVVGGLSYFTFEPTFHVESLSWPFVDLKFALLRTGQKVPTHEHLLSLGDIAEEGAEELVAKFWSGINENQEKSVIESVREFRNWLKAHRWEAPSTTELVENLSILPWVLACKGCGALGADVIIILFYKQNQLLLEEWIARHGLQIVADSNALALGAEMNLNCWGS